MADTEGAAGDAGIIDPTVKKQQSSKGPSGEARKSDRGHMAQQGDVTPPSSDVGGTPQSPLTGQPAKPQGQ